MKYLSVICVAALVLATSCRKQKTYEFPGKPANPRTIQFSLFTDKDFSGNNGNITFTLVIEKEGGPDLWDSVLPVMKIKDIPDLAHKLVVEKAVPGDDNSPLKVGFRYEIENVGNSWYLVAVNPGDAFTKVDYNFH